MAMSQLDLTKISPERVLSAISSARWTTSTPGDQMTHYLTVGARSTRMSAFGPSPASEAILMRAHLTATKDGKPQIQGTCLHRLSPMGKELMKMDPIQIQHRSRPYGVMSSRLQINEFTRRVENARKNADALRSLSLPLSLAEELNAIKKQAIVPRLKLDMDTLTHYAKEHAKSSIVPGLKWAQLPLTREFWEPVFQEVKGVMEEKAFSGQAFDTAFNLGGRQRTSAQVEPNQDVYDVVESRTRVTNFHPALSTVFAFMPEKRACYREIFDNAKDAMDISDHMMTPVVDGGEVYGAAASALYDCEDTVIILGDDCNIYRDGKQFAFDGVNWETQVGTILGQPFHGTKTYFGGLHHVPSGVLDTTIDDSLATMYVYATNPDMQLGVGIPGIMEREDMDEKTNFMLGLSYRVDPNAPRLQGLKLTVDRADAGRVLPSGRNLELKTKYTEEEREAWFLAYSGTTKDGGTLLDFLQDVRAEDFKSGVMDQLVMQQAKV